jgi:hypothetical protein
MLKATTTLQSQLPRHSEVEALFLAAGREVTEGAVMPTAKFAPLPTRIFIPSKTLAMAGANFTIITPIRLTGLLRPVLGRKTSLPPSPFQSGGQSNTRHCHGYAFPRKCWIDFSHRQIDK